MCDLFIGLEHLGDGWGCCGCRTFNGLHREKCKFCGERHCESKAFPACDTEEES